MANAYTYFELKKDGKPWPNQNSNITLVLYTSAGADASITEATAEIGSTGFYVGTLPLTGLSDGWYLAVWTHNNKNKAFFAERILIIDEQQAFVAHEADLDTIIAKLPTNYIMGSDDQADHNAEIADWADGGRLDLLLDAALADTNELQTDWANGGRLDLLIDAILADTNELQSDDYPTSIAAVQAQVDKLDSAAMTAPSSVTNNSFADYLFNKDGSQTYDQSTDSLEAIRDRGDSSWGASGVADYTIDCFVNAAGTPIITIAPKKNGQLYAASTLAVTVYEQVIDDDGTTKAILAVAATNAEGVFTTSLDFTPTAGKSYIVKGTVTMDAASKTVCDGFVAFG